MTVAEIRAKAQLPSIFLLRLKPIHQGAAVAAAAAAGTVRVDAALTWWMRTEILGVAKEPYRELVPEHISRQATVALTH